VDEVPFVLLSAALAGNPLFAWHRAIGDCSSSSTELFILCGRDTAERIGDSIDKQLEVFELLVASRGETWHDLVPGPVAALIEQRMEL